MAASMAVYGDGSECVMTCSDGKERDARGGHIAACGDGRERGAARGDGRERVAMAESVWRWQRACGDGSERVAMAESVWRRGRRVAMTASVCGGVW